ncbi:MAG: 2-C-methyl-D-erythritol 4-phosphate cytidylyltransferase, partial [Gammaproteobacteria bacterium]|nr:2-C-methyl-D-erythritol 4-phosphate cytidylyltransferase [Gammaproteobacteria bacterium]
MRRVWAVVPAAGVGRRMEADRPKQYLQLGKLPIIEHTLFRLLSYGVIEQIVVAISPEDVYWPETQARLNSDRVQTAVGGSERCHSVLNGLKYLEGKAYPEDWVLVH